MIVVIDLPFIKGNAVYGYTNNIAAAIFSEINLYIGGKLIDSHDDKWYDIINEYTVDSNHYNEEILGKYEYKFSRITGS